MNLKIVFERDESLAIGLRQQNYVVSNYCSDQFIVTLKQAADKRGYWIPHSLKCRPILLDAKERILNESAIVVCSSQGTAARPYQTYPNLKNGSLEGVSLTQASFLMEKSCVLACANPDGSNDFHFHNIEIAGPNMVALTTRVVKFDRSCKTPRPDLVKFMQASDAALRKLKCPVCRSTRPGKVCLHFITDSYRAWLERRQY